MILELSCGKLSFIMQSFKINSPTHSPTSTQTQWLLFKQSVKNSFFNHKPHNAMNICASKINQKPKWVGNTHAFPAKVGICESSKSMHKAFPLAIQCLWKGDLKPQLMLFFKKMLQLRLRFVGFMCSKPWIQQVVESMTCKSFWAADVGVSGRRRSRAT